MKKASLFILLAAFIGMSAYAQKRPFTIADLYGIRNVGAPEFSPDGSRIAFTLRSDSLSAGSSRSNLYVIGANGDGLRQLTQSTGSDASPHWSPDGSSIMFTSGRNGNSQAWLLPMSGGEPRAITTFSMGANDSRWLPDGKHVVFTSDVFPECGANSDCNKKNDESISSGPLQAHMADHLLYRHWTSWKDGTRTHTFLASTTSSEITDLTPGDADAPGFSLGGGGFDISPDGKELCVVSNHDTVEARSTNSDLWIIPTDGRPGINITAENHGSDTDPAYSPDGRFIAYRTQATPGYESDLFRLALYDRKTKTREIISGTFDNWITAVRWAPDSRTLYFLADVEGHVPLYSIDVRSHAISLVAEVKTIDDFAISPDGKTIAYTRRSVGEPRELWRMESNGKNKKQLTSFNSALTDAVDFRPAQEQWIPVKGGRKIHTFIVLPHGFDPAKKYPLILNVHGGPQSQWADAFRGDWQVYPGSGYIVAFPNPTGSTGYGQKLTAAISKDWSGAVYDDVMGVTDSLAKLPYVDANRMAAMGWSYGGYMMMWLEGHTDRFKAIACMMGVYDLAAMHGATEELWFPEWDLGGTPWQSDLYQSLSPNRFVSHFKTPCLVITGERDYRVPYTQSLEFFTDLQTMNVPSRLIVFKNDGHWPNNVRSMPFYYNAHLDWFHRYLDGPPAPYDMTTMWKNQAFEKQSDGR